METDPPAYRVAAVQMEPKLGPARCEPRADLELARAGGDGGGEAGRLSRMCPFGIWFFQSRGRARPRGRAR